MSCFSGCGKESSGGHQQEIRRLAPLRTPTLNSTLMARQQLSELRLLRYCDERRRQNWRVSMCEICRLENLNHQAQASRRGLLRFFGAAAAGLALAGTAYAKEV